MPRSLCVALTLVVLGHSSAHAGETEARALYLQARASYEAKRPQQAMRTLERSRKELGRTNPRLDSLELMILASTPNPDSRRVLRVHARLIRTISNPSKYAFFEDVALLVEEARRQVAAEDGLYTQATRLDTVPHQRSDKAARARKAYQVYLKRYPQGAYVLTAQKRIRALGRRLGVLRRQEAHAAKLQRIASRRSKLKRVFQDAMQSGSESEVRATRRKHTSFLTAHPNSRHTSSVRTDLRALDLRQKEIFTAQLATMDASFVSLNNQGTPPTHKIMAALGAHSSVLARKDLPERERYERQRQVLEGMLGDAKLRDYDVQLRSLRQTRDRLASPGHFKTAAGFAAIGAGLGLVTLGGFMFSLIEEDTVVLAVPGGMFVLGGVLVPAIGAPLLFEAAGEEYDRARPYDSMVERLERQRDRHIQTMHEK